MRRAVITGLGIVSCIGIDKKSVEESLRKGTSGISKSPEYELSLIHISEPTRP